MYKPKNIRLAFALISSVVIASCSSTDMQTKKPEVLENTLLIQAVTSRTADEQARDQYRHPVETIAFFQIEPGMTVAEALPGGGWYSKILVNYLGSEANFYGVNYVDDMWARFGFFSPERIEERKAATTGFNGMIDEITDNGINTKGFTFDTAPSDIAGTVDRVLFIRALHNLNRFEAEAGTLTTALKTTHAMLKDDGLVGVVQHRVSENADEMGANGGRGYLKESAVKAAFIAAGFELVASSDINANPKDQPLPKDIVWRLPPSLNGVGDDESKKQAMLAIGESDRMTLLFKKAD
jgi:predicted methyltransferase